METAFERESPLRIRSVRLSAVSAENGLAEMYDRGATENRQRGVIGKGGGQRMDFLEL